MSNRPSDDLLLARIDKAISDLQRIKALVPSVKEHRLRNHGPKPVSMECTRPEAVIRAYEPDPEPLDKRALLYLFQTLERITTSRKLLADRLPALDAQLDNRKLAVEEKPVATESFCIVGCGNSGRLRRGMCESDYRAWSRAGMPDVGIWIPQRQRFLEESEA